MHVTSFLRLTSQNCALFVLSREKISLTLDLNFLIKLTRAPIDTGSCANALPDSLFIDLNLSNPKLITLKKPTFNSVRMACAQKVPIDRQANILFQIGPHFFQDSFSILPTMKSVFLGNPSFKKHNETIDLKNSLLQISDLPVHLNQILSEKGKKAVLRKKFAENSLDFDKKSSNCTSSQVLLECRLSKFPYRYKINQTVVLEYRNEF